MRKWLSILQGVFFALLALVVATVVGGLIAIPLSAIVTGCDPTTGECNVAILLGAGAGALVALFVIYQLVTGD